MINTPIRTWGTKSRTFVVKVSRFKLFLCYMFTV